MLKNTPLPRALTLLLPGILAWSVMSPSSAQGRFDHGPWQALLEGYVVAVDGGSSTRVDYAGMATARDDLQEYLQSLGRVAATEFSRWERSEQLAFLINVYNAWTVELILSAYPELDSIRDLGSWIRPVWKRRFISLFGAQVSLDHVEHELIRGPSGYAEPRIHFAVNCASVGCPALNREAYTGDGLERQLEQATRAFLADRSRNRLRGDTLYVSELFNWYEEDFQQGWRGTSSVAEFLSRYVEALELPAAAGVRLRNDDLPIRYLDYDWSLNDASR
jgi:hypothetical protein